MKTHSEHNQNTTLKANTSELNPSCLSA